MGIKPSVFVGDKFLTKNGHPYTVIDYKGTYEVTVRFDDDSGFEVTTQADNVKKGMVKNPFLPNVYGVGFIGFGRHKSKYDGEESITYSTWMGMFIRCYREKVKRSDSSYFNCSVDPIWHNFQNFADWYEAQEHFGMGYHLDKDLLRQGNRIYSPDLCCLIPPEVNAMIVKPARSKSGLPTGVNVVSKGVGFRARLSERGIAKYIGRFDTIDEARAAYVSAKESYVRNSACEWQDKVTIEVYDSLSEWSVPDDR